MKERLKPLELQHKKVRIRKKFVLLKVHRSSTYYKPKGESRENEILMNTMDKFCLDDPTLGVLGKPDELLFSDHHNEL